MKSDTAEMTGRCYCGAVHLSTTCQPQIVAVCHCTDCRRVTGAAVAAFAVFPVSALTITPDPGNGIEAAPGVRRWFCNACGSPLAATFDYLPGQVYVPVGILNDADGLTPALQCHSTYMLPWVTALQSVPQHDDSGREVLTAASTEP